jgi:hypothetical protein
MESEVSLPSSQESATGPCPEPVESSPHSFFYPVSKTSLIIFSHLRIGLRSGLFPWDFQTQILYAFLIWFMIWRLKWTERNKEERQMLRLDSFKIIAAGWRPLWKVRSPRVLLEYSSGVCDVPEGWNYHIWCECSREMDYELKVYCLAPGGCWW